MRTLILLFVLALVPVSIRAQAAHDDEARALFEAAQLAYGDGRYEEALDYFERGHELSGRPELLYNIALAAEHLRHDARALEAYEAYLAAVPTTEHRASIEARIRILREALAAQPAVSEEPTPVETSEEPVVEPPPASTSGGGLAVGGLVLAIGGGAALIAGGVLAGLAAADTSTVEGATYPASWSDVRGAYDRAFPFSVAGWTLVGVGAAALVAGIVWLVVGDGSPAEVAIGPGGAVVRGHF